MTNHFYSSEQTDLSRTVLGEVVAAVPAAILIGGWGSWVRTGGPMSHDVDLIVTRGELAILERMAGDLSESHHLAGTKWRATWRSIDLDLYVPFQSRLGANLQLRVRIPMIPYTQSDVFGRGRRRPRSGRRLGAYPVSSPPSWCLIDSLQALKLAVERVEMAR